jgi:hypothetical protein
MTISDLGAGGLVDIVDLNDGSVAATTTGAWTASSATDNSGGAASAFTIAVASAGAVNLSSASTTDAGYTVNSTGTSAITGSDDVDALTNISGATSFTGGTGADTITFAAAGTVEQVIFTATTDGATVGVDGAGDSVVTFVSTEDKVNIDGALQTLFDDQGSADAALAWEQVDAATDGSAEAIDANDGTDEAIMLDGSELAVADFDDISMVAAELEEEINLTAATGEDLLIVIEDTATNDFGVWSYVETGDTANNFDVADLTLLGIFTADAVAAGDFAII